MLGLPRRLLLLPLPLLPLLLALLGLLVELLPDLMPLILTFLDSPRRLLLPLPLPLLQELVLPQVLLLVYSHFDQMLPPRPVLVVLRQQVPLQVGLY